MVPSGIVTSLTYVMLSQPCAVIPPAGAVAPVLGMTLVAPFVGVANNNGASVACSAVIVWAAAVSIALTSSTGVGAEVSQADNTRMKTAAIRVRAWRRANTIVPIEQASFQRTHTVHEAAET